MAPWEACQPQALTGLSGDFFELNRLTQDLQSNFSSEVPRAFQQVKQTPWRNFLETMTKIFLPKLVVEN